MLRLRRLRKHLWLQLITFPPTGGDQVSPRAIAELEPKELRRQLALSTLRALAFFGAVLAVYFIIPDFTASDLGTWIQLIVGMVLFVVILGWQVKRIRTADIPELRAIEVLAFALALFLVLFAGIYLSLSASDPGNFSEPLSRISSLYFTVVTFGTVGFGDITPTSDLGRLVASAQVILDLVFIGLIVRVILGASKRTLESRK